MSNQQNLNVNIDLKNTQPITSPEGNHVFIEGMILRKISKFVAGTPEDAVMPIPVFVDQNTGKILVNMLPKELREEYQEMYDKEDASK
jgi:hypothetical protein